MSAVGRAMPAAAAADARTGRRKGDIDRTERERGRCDESELKSPRTGSRAERPPSE